MSKSKGKNPATNQTAGLRRPPTRAKKAMIVSTVPAQAPGSEWSGGGDDAPDRRSDRPEPEDVLFTTQREAATLMGVHYNTVHNWYENGHGPIGDAPHSLKEWCCQLRPVGRLSKCKPTDAAAHAIWSWAFLGDLGQAVNPDDPVHPPPQGWPEEQQRQVALGSLTNRRRAQIELETLEGLRIPIEEYRIRRIRDCEAVVTLLDSVHAAVRDLPGLTLEQRSAQNIALAKWVADVRLQLSNQAPIPEGVPE